MRKHINKHIFSFVVVMVMLLSHMGMFPQTEMQVSADGGYNLHVWVSDSEMGDCPDDAYYHKGIMYYLCYELTDSSTGRRISDSISGYSVEETIYKPNGNVAHTYNYGASTDNWIGHRVDTLGTYRGTVRVTGSIDVECSVSWKVTAPDVNLHAWISDSKMGNVPNSFKLGEMYYLCYELTDLHTNKRLSEDINGYSVTETIYYPDGSIGHEHTYDNSNNNWIGRLNDAAGKWKGTVTVKGDFEVSVNVSWNTEAPSYNVTFNANGGSVSTSSKTVTNGSNYGTLPIPTRTGYSFAGWYTSSSDGTQITSNSTVSLTSNQTLYAHWTANPYTVYFNANSGSVSTGSKTVTYGSTYGTLPIPTRTGYTFVGWYTSSSGGTQITSNSTVSLTSNQTLYAHWEADAYTIYFDANGGYISTSRKMVTNGSTYGTLPIPTRNGYTFLGWYTSSSGGSLITSNSTVSLTSNQTLYAHWILDPIVTSSTSIPKITTTTTITTVTTRITTTTKITTKVSTIATTVTTRVTTTTIYISPMLWGRDNWNFDNSSKSGDFRSSKYINQIGEPYLSKLKGSLTNSEYTTIFKGHRWEPAWIYDNWSGSCYGMSSLLLIARSGGLPYSSYQNNAKCLSDFLCPTKNNDIESLITYYQMLQIKSKTQALYEKTSKKSNEENIRNVISLIDNTRKPVLIGFSQKNWGGHAIVAYDYEYGSWKINGITYQGRLMICDPNHSKSFDSQYCLYFNTNSYNWTIPNYENTIYKVKSTNGARFNYVGNDLSIINDGGYLGSIRSKYEATSARLDTYAAAENCSINKVSGSSGNYNKLNSAEGDIEEDYSVILHNESNTVSGYCLRDTTASYIFSQDDPHKMELVLNYGDSLYTVYSEAGYSTIFDRDGKIIVKNDSSDYSIGLTFDEDYPTDWFSINIEGTGTDKASLEKVEEGYVLTADNLDNVTASAYNKEDCATAKFSAEGYDSCLIYEIDKNTIGIKVDTDNNGTYETSIPVSDLENEGSENDKEIMYGDVDLSGSVELADITRLAKYLLSSVTYPLGDSETSNQKAKRNADINGDGRVDALDLSKLIEYNTGKLLLSDLIPKK